MRRSTVGWSTLAIASAIGTVWVLSGATAFAQQGSRADADIPAKKKALGEIFDARSEKNDEAAAIQKNIDDLSDQTDELLAKYRTVLTQIDSIRVYNYQLHELMNSQEEELTSLQSQLDRIEVVGRSVTPLMLRMIDALDATVALDLPYLLEERAERIEDLRKLMSRAAVTSSEKFRMIMDGRTIEVYRSTLQRGDREIKVDFLRFGRIALVYQTLDGRETGVWNQAKKTWDPLDASYRSAIREGLRIGRKQAAPDLIRLPLPVPGRGEALAQETDSQSETTSESAAEAAVQAAPIVAPRAAPPEPKSLDELLEMVRDGFESEDAANQRRVAEFKRNRADQQRLLDEALAILAGEEASSQQMEIRYNENELQLGTAQQRMTERLGELGELFGVVRMVATDLGAQTWDSMTSAEGGSQRELLDRLGRSEELPSTEDLEKLWLELQREITKQGKVVRFRTTIRAGPFTAISDGRYLVWEPEDQQFRELNRQPPSRHLDTVASFENATTAYAKLAVDPSRGGLLVMLTDTPSTWERVNQGGAVGWVIISLGVLAGLVGVWRWNVVVMTSHKVNAQRKSEAIDLGNPLGRILERNRDRHDPDVSGDHALRRGRSEDDGGRHFAGTGDDDVGSDRRDPAGAVVRHTGQQHPEGNRHPG